MSGTLQSILASFHVEVCMLATALILFKVLHRGLDDAQLVNKVAPSKPSDRSMRPADRASTTKAVGPDYSKLIKACGQTQDLERARELWDELAAERKPDWPSLCSMVDVLVASQATEEAWDLVKRLVGNTRVHFSGYINIYATLLRGFAKAKQHDKVCALYDEMVARRIPMNTITYNTVLNSMVRIGRMDEIPEFLQAMKAGGPREAPDLVTFSTIVNGYCRIGDIDAGLRLLDFMIEMEVKPDEFTFNSLLGGCAKQRRLKEAVGLLNLMQEQGVPPSNFTLSIAMKILGRARKLSQAFEMTEQVSKAYGFQPNIQVYTCLMQACFHSRRVSKALSLYNRIVEEKAVSIDRKTYTVLARGCLENKMMHKAVKVVRAAYHLPNTGEILVPEGPPQGVMIDCLKELFAALRRTDPDMAAELEAELSTCESPPSWTGGRGRAANAAQ